MGLEIYVFMFTVTTTDSKKRSSNLALSHHDRNTIHDHTWMNDVARTRKQRVPNDTTMKKEKGMASQQKIMSHENKKALDHIEKKRTSDRLKTHERSKDFEY